MYFNNVAIVWLYRFFLLLIVSVVGFLSVFVLWGGFGFSLGVFGYMLGHVTLYTWVPLFLLGPFGLFFVQMALREYVTSEAALVRAVGPELALWSSFHNPNGINGPAVRFIEHALLTGHDASKEFFQVVGRLLNLPAELQLQIDKGVWALASIAYSKIILALDSVESTYFGLIMGSLGTCFMYSSNVKRLGRFMANYFAFLYTVCLVFWYLPPSFVLDALLFLAKCAVFIRRIFNQESLFFEWLQWRFTYVAIQFIGYVESLNYAFQSKYSANLSKGSHRLSSDRKSVV